MNITAVEWLVNKVYMVIPDSERNFLEGLKEMAKEMEKDRSKIDFKNRLQSRIFRCTM